MSSEESDRIRAVYKACVRDVETRYTVDTGMFGTISDFNPWIYDCMKSRGYGYKVKAIDRPA